MYISDTEEQPYEVLTTFDEVEIRHYPPARMISVQTPTDTSRRGNDGQFRVLANYIFGGNEREEKFAMTAPVHMEQEENSRRMSFVLPQSAWQDSLPTPNDSAVQMHWSKDDYVAAIRYSGYTNPQLEAEYQKKIIEVLKEQGIRHYGNFRSLGYDPPFKMNDRRNEVIVSIDPESKAF